MENRKIGGERQGEGTGVRDGEERRDAPKEKSVLRGHICGKNKILSAPVIVRAVV